MELTLFKRFHFSASHSASGKIYGHNYTLEVGVEPLDAAAEANLQKKIEESLIRKLDSRDLGLHVDFLKGVELSDAGLLKIFAELLSRELSPVHLRSLALERDSKTRVHLSLDK